jgi:drug/metabolite transporter (DMT)-like permease
MSLLPALLASTLFACSAVFARQSVHYLGSAAANAARLSVAALILAFYAHIWGQGWTGPGLPWFLWSGFVGFGLGDVALFYALPRIGSRLTLILCQCLAAPFAVLTESTIFGIVPSLAHLGWMSIILMGVALALWPSAEEWRQGDYRWAGICAGIIAALGQAGGAVLSHQAFLVNQQAEVVVDGMTSTYQRIIAGVVVAWLYLMVSHQATPLLVNWRQGKLYQWLSLNIMAGPVLGVACYQWALSQNSSGLVLALVATSPLLVIPLAWLIEKDRPSPRSLAGSVLAVAGVIGLLTMP